MYGVFPKYFFFYINKQKYYKSILVSKQNWSKKVPTYLYIIHTLKRKYRVRCYRINRWDDKARDGKFTTYPLHVQCVPLNVS